MSEETQNWVIKEQDPKSLAKYLGTPSPKNLQNKGSDEELKTTSMFANIEKMSSEDDNQKKKNEALRRSSNFTETFAKTREALK